MALICMKSILQWSTNETFTQSDGPCSDERVKGPLSCYLRSLCSHIRKYK